MKKLLSIFVCIFLLCGVLLAGSIATVADILMFGDPSGDSNIDSSDARMVLQYEVGLIRLNPAQELVANVNGDTSVDSSDARLILQFEVALIEHFPVEQVERESKNEVFMGNDVEEIYSTKTFNELVSYDDTSNTYIFSKINDGIRRLQHGDKVVILPCNSFPDGCAIKVDRLEIQEDTAVITSQKVQLSDIVATIDVAQSIPMTADMITEYGDGVTPQIPVATQNAGMMRAAASVTMPIPTLDINIPINENLEVTGSIFVSPTLNVDIDLHKGWFNIPTGVDRFLVSLSNNMKSNLKVEAKADGTIVDMAKVYRLQDGSLKEKYANYKLTKAKAHDYTQKLFASAFPIPTTPGLAVTVSWYITVTAEGSISVEAILEQSTMQGIKLENGVWSAINEESKTLTLCGSADAAIYAGVGMEIGLSYVGIVAANIAPEIGIEIKASTEITGSFFGEEEDEESSHDCWLCVDGDVNLKFQIVANVTAIGFGAVREGYILSPTAKKIGDFYITFGGETHGTAWGWGVCPYNPDAKSGNPLEGLSTFAGHTYKVFDESMAWHEAKQYCETLGGHLATVTSQEEQNFVASLIGLGNKGYYWLGATDENIEGSWGWVTDEPFEYTHWDWGEPNNLSYEDFRSAEGYLEINASHYRWNDIKNVGDTIIPLSHIGFVCEWESDN